MCHHVDAFTEWRVEETADDEGDEGDEAAEPAAVDIEEPPIGEADIEEPAIEQPQLDD